MARKHYSAEDYQKIPLQNVVIQTASSDPSSPAAGQIYYNTVSFRYRIYANGSWVNLTTPADLPTSLPPSGAAGGSLGGTYPNPSISADGITSPLAFVTAMRGTGANGGTALDTDLALRSLGLAAGKAMPGTSTLGNIGLTANNQDINFNSYKGTNVATPTAAGDAANKSYVDGVAQGLSIKAPCQYATQANVTLSGTAAQDDWQSALTAGVTRILVKAQTTAANNGIYVVQAGAWTRATDADTAAELQSAFTFVELGTNANTGWYQTQDSVTVGSSTITWVQFSSAGAYTAGAGLGLTGLDFSVNVDGSSLQITSDTLSVKPLGITSAMLATGAVDLTSNKVTGTLPLTNGGTAATSAAAALVSLGAAGKNSIGVPALTAGTWTALSFSPTPTNTACVYKFYTISTNEEVEIEHRLATSGNIEVRADIAVASNTLFVAAVGA